MTTTKQNDKRLFLLDGMALTYRAHFALIRNPRFTTGGLCTSAVFGFVNTLLDLIKRENPTHLAVAFDTPEPTARHREFPEYKAQRDSLPEDIGLQLPYIDRILEAFNICTIRIPGFEADDIIGTLAFQASEKEFETWMVTPDKDYHQLVSDNVFVYKPGRKGGEREILGVPEILDAWQIQRISQVIDVLGLMGDTADNIPGVPGIGPKTAQKLIGKFDSIEGLLGRTDELKGKQKERVVENAEQALLSKRLVTIQLDVPHDIELESLEWTGHNDKQLKPLLEELEFDTIGKRIFGASFSSASNRSTVIREKREAEIQADLFGQPLQEKSIADVPHEYHTIKTKKERSQLIEKLLAQQSFCFDTETTGLDPRIALPLGIAFAFEPNSAYYVVCPTEKKKALEVVEEFKSVFENQEIGKIGHNLKYDITLLKWHGINIRGELMDTMLAHSMKEPEMRHGLDYLAKLYLGYTPISTESLIGAKGPEQKNMRDVPIEKVAEYACEDADITLQVANAIRPDIESRGVSKVCYEVECPLVPVLVDMEFEGIRLNTESLEKFAVELGDDIETLRSEIHQAAGREFNIDSPKQLGIVLFDEMKLESKPKKTATGQYSTRETELERLANKHEIIAKVLDYRTATKLKSVYVDQLPNAVNPKTGHLHTHYSQTWTATGRLQSNDPNLQTIPIRKKRGRGVRAAFVPRNDDYLILSADYSQIELRVMAELSGDSSMIEAFQSQTDIHAVTASKVFDVSIGDVTREMRDKAKTVNFGIIYGISPFGLQQRLNIPRAQAKELIDNYFEKYPGVQKYIDASIEFARENGFVKTISGRRRYLRDINSRSKSLAKAAERLAMNSPIQGTAADMIKLAMTSVSQALRANNFKTKMLLTVHDELVFDMLKSEQSAVMPVIQHAMTTALPMKVPIVVEMGVGQNWLEAH